MTSVKKEELRLDHRIIGEMIEPGSVVLDLGCEFVHPRLQGKQEWVGRANKGV